MNYKTIGKAINFVERLSPSLAQKISFRLFTSPRPRKQKPQEQAFLETATQRTILNDGKKIQAYIWGDGDRKVLFSHGWESNAGRWRSFIPGLVAAGFQVVAFDAPGHGASEGKRLHLVIFMSAIQAMFKEFGAFEALVGHSMGAGASVMCLATQQLPRPKKMVLLGSFAEVSEVYKGYTEMIGLTPKLAPKFNETIKRLSGHDIAYFSVAEKAGQLHDIQGLIIHDKQDKTINIEEARNIAKSWPSAQYIETDGAGHSLQNEHIFTEVISFIAS